MIQDQGEGWEKERSMGVDTGHNARCSANMFQRAEEWIEGRWEYVVGHGQAPTAPAHFWSIVACWGKKKSRSFPDFSVITQLLKTCLNVEERRSCKSKSQEATGDSLPILGPHSAMVSCRCGVENHPFLCHNKYQKKNISTCVLPLLIILPSNSKP